MGLGQAGSLFDSVARVVAEPWGVVMLADLYAGFLAATALFFLFERRGSRSRCSSR